MTGWRAATASITGSSTMTRAHVAAQCGEMGEVGQQIGFSDGGGAAANAAGGFEDGLAQLDEDALFDFDGAVVRGENLALVLLELGSGEALGIDQRLLALVIGGRVGQVGLGDLNVIAEDGVIADFERADAGALALAFFDGGDRLAAGGGDGAQFVELCVDAGGNCAAIDQCERRFGDQSGFNARGGLFERIEALGERAPERGLHRFQRGFQGRQLGEAGGQGADVAGAGGIERKTGEQTLEIEDAGEGAADFFALDQIGVSFGYGFVAGFEGLRHRRAGGGWWSAAGACPWASGRRRGCGRAWRGRPDPQKAARPVRGCER